MDRREDSVLVLLKCPLREIIIDKEFKEGRRITLEEIARGTEIQRTTLSRISGQRGYNTTTDNIDNRQNWVNSLNSGATHS
jgi:hypothetical protein